MATKNTFITVIMTLLLCLSLSSPALASESENDSNKANLPEYGIQPGDVLLISVWREQDLTTEVLVRPDGGISFPLAGDLNAAGKTISEVTDIVTERLAKYISDPVVNVSIRQLSGNKIYVIGKVIRPGEYPVTRYVDVMQALSMAGGVNPFASTNNIKILRRTNGNQETISFRYSDVESGRNLEQNIILKSGDVVVVP